MQKHKSFKISIDKDERVEIEIAARHGSLWLLSAAEAKEYAEASLQIQEACSYEYKLTKGYALKELSSVVKPSHFDVSCGIIRPGNYVGLLKLEVVDLAKKSWYSDLLIEVRSIKTDYRTDYRLMLEEIAEKCTELIMQFSSVVTQKFTQNQHQQSWSLY